MAKSHSGGRGNRGILAEVLELKANGTCEIDVKSFLASKGYAKGRMSQLMLAFRGGATPKNSLKVKGRNHASVVKKDVALKADHVARARRVDPVKTKPVLRRPSSCLPTAPVDEHLQQGDELPPCTSAVHESFRPDGQLLKNDPGAVWEWLNASLDKAGDPRCEFTRELENFSRFTSYFRKEIEQAGHTVINMPCGPCGGSERCLAQYLLHVRWHDAPGTPPREKPLPVDDLRRRAGRIRNGAAEYSHLVTLPPWLVAGNDYSSWLCKQFAAWGREDATDFAKAKHEHVVLLGSSIEEFCISVGVQLIEGTQVSDRQLVCTLACRFQSGTNARYYNQTDIKWGHVTRGKGLGEYGCFQICNTKRISATQRSIKSISMTRSAVSRYIDDDVTGLLFEEHCRRHATGRSGDECFFPAFNGDVIDWKRPLQNATLNAFIQSMVVSMDIATSEKSGLYTTTAIRRGNQAVTEAQVQKYRQQRNKDCGWAKDSFVPQKSYTPDTVALAPGPLFWDIKQSNEALRKASLHMRVALLNKRSCKECGMPVCLASNECKCAGCNEIIASRGSGSKARLSHSACCWRKGQRRHTKALPKKVWDEWRPIISNLSDIDARYENGYTFVARGGSSA